MIEYPYYARFKWDTSLKVLFTAHKTGTVIAPGCDHVVGESRTDWLESNFHNTGEAVMRKLKAGDIIIGSQNKITGNVSFAASPSLHGSLAEARIEAERLAAQDTSKRFLVVDIKGVCEATSVSWS